MDPTKIKFLDATAKWATFLGFFGLINLKEIGRSTGKASYTTSPTRTAYCATILFLFTCLFIIQIASGNGIFYRYLGGSFLNIYIVYNGFPVTILLLLTSLLDSKRYGKIITKIFDCEYDFEKRDNTVIERKSIKFFSAFFLIFLSSLIFDVVRLYYEGGNWIKVLNPIASFACAMYCMICVLQFSMMQYWLERAFTRINTALIGFCKMDKECFNLARVSLLSDDILRDIVTIETLKISSHKIKPSNIHESIKDKIKKLRQLYNQVFKISRELDEFFSNRNILIVSANLIMSIIYLFLILQFTTLYARAPEPQTGMDLISSIKGALISLSNIWSLVIACRNTCTEAIKTALIIQDTILNVNDPELKTELRDFATQLQHETVRFSPHGFFEFENSMLLSILSAVATYLVILIQFHPPKNQMLNEIPAAPNTSY